MTNSNVIDLRSDTLTQPTPGMREAMATASVGDDVFGEDPTVNALQDRCATLFGKEAALFVPTGTMANLLGLLSQSRPGETILLHETGHAYNYEGGNVAAFGGLMTRLFPGTHGKLTPDILSPYLIRKDDPHYSQPAVVSIENTTNMGGGIPYSIEEAMAVYNVSRDALIPVHCDGARIMNACVSTGASPSSFGVLTDTITCCFSKGLGAPAGSILAGSQEVISRAHRYRKMLGGGMRQVGVLAAAALFALEHHVERLAEDHANAARFRQSLEVLSAVTLPDISPTNIVFFEVENAEAVVAKADVAGVRMLALGPGRIRAVFHLDISTDDTDRAIDLLSGILA